MNMSVNMYVVAYGVRVPGNGVTSGCELPHMGTGNSGALEEEYTLSY